MSVDFELINIVQLVGWYTNVWQHSCVYVYTVEIFEVHFFIFENCMSSDDIKIFLHF